jgi:hypothetical protein
MKHTEKEQTDFHKTLYTKIIISFVDTKQFWLKSGTNNEDFT